MREVGGRSVETHTEMPLPYVAPIAAPPLLHTGSAEITVPLVGESDAAALQAASEVRTQPVDNRDITSYLNTPRQGEITVPGASVDTIEAAPRDAGLAGLLNRPYYWPAPIVIEEPGTPAVVESIPETISVTELTDTASPKINMDAGWPVTIVHTRSHDIVTNNQHPDQALVAQAAVAVNNGMPENWVRVRTGDVGKHYYADSFTTPTLFAKVYDGSNNTIEQSGRSILNDFSTAPEVREVVQREMVQDIARSLGYASISFIEPLTAVSHKKTGQQTVVYPYQPGVDTGTVAERSHPLHKQTDSLSALGYCIKTLLRERGIVSHGIASDHFIVAQSDDGPRLYLVGAYSYSRQPPSRSAA